MAWNTVGRPGPVFHDTEPGPDKDEAWAAHHRALEAEQRVAKELYRAALDAAPAWLREDKDHPVPDDIAEKMLSLVVEYNQRAKANLACGYIRTWDEAKDIFPNRAVWRVNNAAVSAQNIKKTLQTS